MIWFNGFPYLDNKEEHSFGVPVSTAMTPLNRITVLPATGTSLRRIERLLSDSTVQGFPIVDDLATYVLIGYIGRTELRYAIERAKRDEAFLSADAVCVFAMPDATEGHSASTTAATQAPTSTTPAPLIQPSPTFPSNPTIPHIDLTKFPDQTPLTVHPSLPLETTMELFKKLGPRVILVEYHGRLTGLVTVKDCLRYQFTAEAAEHSREDARLAAKEEMLWGAIKRYARWTRDKVGRWTGGRVVLREPGESAFRAGGGGRASDVSSVNHDELGREREGVTEMGPTDGREEVVRAVELEERFPGGGTGSS